MNRKLQVAKPTESLEFAALDGLCSPLKADKKRKFAIFQAKMAMAGFEIKLTSKGEIRGVKRGAKLGKAEAKSANNPNFKTNSLASLS